MFLGSILVNLVNIDQAVLELHNDKKDIWWIIIVIIMTSENINEYILITMRIMLFFLVKHWIIYYIETVT